VGVSPTPSSCVVCTTLTIQPTCSPLNSILPLISIPKSHQSLNGLAPGLSTLIRSPKLQTQQPRQTQRQTIRNQTSRQAGNVARGVLLPEHGRADDAADCAAADEGCGGEGAFPLL
jgi:hypothetical protein